MTVDEEKVIRFLRGAMDFSRLAGVRFEPCLREARKQFNASVREAADATPLEEVTGTGPRK